MLYVVRAHLFGQGTVISSWAGGITAELWFRKGEVQLEEAFQKIGKSLLTLMSLLPVPRPSYDAR